MKNQRPRSQKRHSHGKKNRGGKPELPELATLTITEITAEGDVFAIPAEWNERRQPPHIEVIESSALRAVGTGDRILARMRRIKPHLYQALVIRILPRETARRITGIFVGTAGGGGLIEPVSRKDKVSYLVAPEDIGDARHGDLVSGVTLPDRGRQGMAAARVEECIGDMRSPRAASLIAAQLYDLPSVFEKAALQEAEAAEPPVMEAGREDLRAVPLVTIDGEDARDFDDAVFAEPDPQAEGGFHVIVAIADVAHYVKDGGALDRAAFERGNSVYFPDRVIPMLPERLSNDLCSLNPRQDRYCLAVHLWIDGGGATKRYRFVRGLMRSHARLTYNQVEHYRDAVDKEIQPLVRNLRAAYQALARERDERGALALNLPEFKVLFGGNGEVEQIMPRPQWESHRLIESFMVAANVAAAGYLLEHRAPGIYRAHEPPSPEKLDELRQFLGLSGYSFPKGNVTPHHLNTVLRKAEQRPDKEVIHNAVLRSQMQAFYSHQNIGHFGLGLRHYCHFTSPIRRYSDLVVHRSLAALIAQDKRKLPGAGRLPEIALHISETERRAMLAERDATDRYKVLFMSRHLGNSFTGRITGLNEYGLYVTLPENGITGFIPLRHLSGDFFVYEKKHARFQGHRSKKSYSLGDVLAVRVVEANVLTNNLLFQPEESVPKVDHDRRAAAKKSKKGKERKPGSPGGKKMGGGKRKHVRN